jgi:hypothetical protein
VNPCDRSLLFEEILDAIREDSIGRCQHVELLPQENDLPVRRYTAAEAALMHWAPRDSELLVNRVLTECLIRRVDIANPEGGYP